MARPFVYDLVKIYDELLMFKPPIYEFGSYQVYPFQEKNNLRPIFEGRQFVGTDIRPGPGVDQIIDMTDIRMDHHSIGTAICLDTLEHIQEPKTALYEVCDCLNEDGMTLIVSVMNFPIHEQPDYWRFTPDGFKYLLKDFPYSYTNWAGREDFPHTVIGIGFKGQVSPVTIQQLDALTMVWRDSIPTGEQNVSI
jgi:hypothetical protein